MEQEQAEDGREPGRLPDTGWVTPDPSTLRRPDAPEDAAAVKEPGEAHSETDHVTVTITVGKEGILNVEGPLSPRDMLAVLQEATSEVLLTIAGQRVLSKLAKAQQGIRTASPREVAKLRL